MNEEKEQALRDYLQMICDEAIQKIYEAFDADYDGLTSDFQNLVDDIDEVAQKARILF